MDYLDVIKRVMEEHKVVMERLDFFREVLSDREALMSLDKVGEDLMVDFKATASEKRNRLEQTLTLLEAGLKNHYAFEEEALRPLLGELLMEALLLEHGELLAAIQQVKAVIRSVRLEGLSRNELVNEEAVMYGLLNRIKRQKEDHLNREEAMLTLLQEVLEHRAKQPQPRIPTLPGMKLPGN